MRGFPKWINTPEDLDICAELFPEETSAKMEQFTAETMADPAAKIGEEKTVKYLGQLTRLGIREEDAKAAATRLKGKIEEVIR